MTFLHALDCRFNCCLDEHVYIARECGIEDSQMLMNPISRLELFNVDTMYVLYKLADIERTSKTNINSFLLRFNPYEENVDYLNVMLSYIKKENKNLVGIR